MLNAITKLLMSITGTSRTMLLFIILYMICIFDPILLAPIIAEANTTEVITEINEIDIDNQLLMFPEHFLKRFVEIINRKDDTGLETLVRSNMETAVIVRFKLMEDLLSSGKVDNDLKKLNTFEKPKSFSSPQAYYYYILSTMIANFTNIPIIDLSGESDGEIVRNPYEKKKTELYRLSKKANIAFQRDETANNTLVAWEQALKVAREIGDVSAQVYFHKGLLVINAYAGHKEKAEYHSSRFYDLSYSPFNNENSNNIEEIDLPTIYSRLDREYLYKGESLEWAFGMATRFYHSQNYSESIRFWKKCLSGYGQIDSDLLFISHRHIGICYLRIGQYQSALDHLKRSLEIANAEGSKKTQVMLLAEVSSALFELGEYDQALQVASQSQILSQDVEKISQTETLLQIGKIYSAFGHYEESADYLRQIMEIPNIAPYLKVESGLQLVSVLTKKNDTNSILEAINLGQKIVIYSMHYDYFRLIPHSLIMLARAYRLNGNNLIAFHLLQKALIYTESLGDLSAKASIYYELSGCLYPIDKANKEASATILLAIINGYFSNIFHSTSLGDECISLLRESVKLFKESGNLEGLWRANAAIAKLQSDVPAIQSYEISIEIIEKLRSKIVFEKDRLFFDSDRLYVYDEFISLLMVLHGRYPESKYDRKAFEMFERRQGRQFMEQLRRSSVVHFRNVPDDIIRQERDLEQNLIEIRYAVFELSRNKLQLNKSLLSELKGRLLQFERDHQLLRDNIKTNYTEYFNLTFQEPVGIGTLQQGTLSAGEAIWIYKVLENETILWEITPTNFESFRLPIGFVQLQEEISLLNKMNNDIPLDPALKRPKVQTPRPQLSRQPLSSIIEKSFDLFRLLVPSKISTHLNSINSLYIVPSGPLYNLPFEALIIENGLKKGLSPRYLIEACPVSYLSSASLLNLLRKPNNGLSEKPKYPLIAFYDPVYQKHQPTSSSRDNTNNLRKPSFSKTKEGNFPSMKDSKAMIREISTILHVPIDSEALYADRNASKSKVFELNEEGKLRQYRYVIFSCHGIIPDETSFLNEPALILSEPDPITGIDSYLTMSDAFKLHLNADVVVLSACNTGSGKLVEGEGVIGLTRAFMFAGTPSLVVTLWPITSSAAKIIGTGFFRNLRDGKSRAEALRQIKIAMIQGREGSLYCKPNSWAPMVLFGDGR